MSEIKKETEWRWPWDNAGVIAGDEVWVVYASGMGRIVAHGVVGHSAAGNRTYIKTNATPLEWVNIEAWSFVQKPEPPGIEVSRAKHEEEAKRQSFALLRKKFPGLYPPTQKDVP